MKEIKTKKIDKKGYVWVYVPKHPYSKPKKSGFLQEHRIVTENFIKRKLKSGWCIHHLDLNKENNQISNLMIFKTHKEHSAWHNKLKKFPYLTNQMKLQIKNRWEEYCQVGNKMREIKFRAWNKEKKKFEYFILASHAPISTVKIPAKGTWDALEDWEQFTGLKDKNKKEIYEGDIVKQYGDSDLIGKICFHNGCFCFAEENNKVINREYFNLMKGNHMEVIGNICRNPKLLEENNATNQ